MKRSNSTEEQIIGVLREQEAPTLTATTPNARWSAEFVHDQLVIGRRLRTLNVVDDVTKECLAGAYSAASIIGSIEGRARGLRSPPRAHVSIGRSP